MPVVSTGMHPAGRMLGVLLAQDPHTGRAVTLKAFSGQLTERWEVPGWVGPVARITSASPQYKQQREKIEGISAQMQQIEQKQQLQQTAAPGVVVQSGTSTASQGQPGAPGTALTTTGQGLQGDKELQRQRRLLRQQQRDPRRSWHPDARAEYERLVAERRQLSHELIRNVQVGVGLSSATSICALCSECQSEESTAKHSKCGCCVAFVLKWMQL
jgi:hypothetical protein